MRRGRYYLGRVIKINLSQDQLMEAMIHAKTINVGKFDWTITDVMDCRDDDVPFVYGRLSKYARDGHATVIDELSRAQQTTSVPNLLEASASFVYIPSCSGIAFLHVWNGIQYDVFTRRFKTIIEDYFDAFLIACDIEPISDYRAFTSRLRKLDLFTEFSATVFPPNPLFGRLWANLNDYIKARNASEVTVKEQTSKPEGLKSKIIPLMENILENSKFEPSAPVDISDAAILMAADGYGRGKVKGLEQGELVEVKTSDTQKSFLWDMEPDPQQLAAVAYSHFSKVSSERDMGH